MVDLTIERGFIELEEKINSKEGKRSNNMKPNKDYKKVTLNML